MFGLLHACTGCIDGLLREGPKLAFNLACSTCHTMLFCRISNYEIYVYEWLWFWVQESKLYGAHFKEIGADAPKSTKITFNNSDDEE